MKNVKMLVAIVVLAGIGLAAEGRQAAAADQQQAERDRLVAAVQQICPVSGNKLGEHGAPTKVQIGKETIFLCCKGCLGSKVSAKHWATIHANFARAQGRCPVMKKALPENPKWTVVQGRIVYVCCPPCIKKIEADPATYLKQVDEYYAASLGSS